MGWTELGIVDGVVGNVMVRQSQWDEPIQKKLFQIERAGRHGNALAPEWVGAEPRIYFVQCPSYPIRIIGRHRETGRRIAVRSNAWRPAARHVHQPGVSAGDGRSGRILHRLALQVSAVGLHQPRLTLILQTNV